MKVDGFIVVVVVVLLVSYSFVFKPPVGAHFSKEFICSQKTIVIKEQPLLLFFFFF